MKNENDDKQTNEHESKKLTLEELNSIEGFENYSLLDKQELINTVFNLSLVLFKNFEDE
jgi:hypothetical protein